MLLRVKTSDFVGLVGPFLESEKVHGVIQVEAGETGKNLAPVLCACSGVLALPCLYEPTKESSSFLALHCCHHAASSSRALRGSQCLLCSKHSASFPDPPVEAGALMTASGLTLLGTLPAREPHVCSLGPFSSS